MHWKERFGEIKYSLATILAKMMPKLAPNLLLCRDATEKGIMDAPFW
jgi:hypothetical protein